MSSINQDIKFGPPNPLSNTNPLSLFEFIKPSRILFSNDNPDDDDGTMFDYFLNTTTGDFFEKDRNGAWILEYNFATGGGGSDITNIENDGTGVGWFRNIIGSTAHFKSVLGATDQIDILDLDSEVQVAMNPVYKPQSLSRVNNFPLQVGIGGATLDPNGLLGTPEGYNRGSLFIQVGTEDIIWICNDPALKIWKIFGFIGEIKDIENVGDGTADIFKQTTPEGVAELRTLDTLPNEIVIDQTSDKLTFRMNSVYKPFSLFKVQNIKNSQGEASPPNANDDSTAGYSVGSLWTTSTQVYLCENNAAGSAVWNLVEGGLPEPKESAMYYNNVRPIINYVDTTWFQPPTTSTQVTFAGGATWSAVYSGSTLIYRRGPTNAANKRYLVTMHILIGDFAGATTSQHNYEFRMKQFPSGVVQNGSQIQLTLNAATTPNRDISSSTSFIITSLTAGQDDYRLETRGTIPGSGTPAPSIGLDRLTITFTEI